MPNKVFTIRYDEDINVQVASEYRERVHEERQLVQKKLAEIVQGMNLINDHQINVITYQLKNVIFDDDWIVHVIRV